jgi:1,4-dihydroxy-2-naphthoate octaprenyltransferase
MFDKKYLFMLGDVNVKMISMETITAKEKIFGWLRLSRPPFHSVGVIPFILGTLLAWNLDHSFHVYIFILGVLAVVLIMMSTYQAGEYYDEREDTISQSIFRSRFAGGSGVTQEGLLSRKVPLWTSIFSIVMAAIIGIILQFGLKTGPYTIPLGAIGLFAGFFYSTRPVRIVERGVGEIVIGFCYGWLPVAVAFYIQTGYIHHIIHWMGIPIGLTIFNVIFLNEFLDYRADSISGKRNLLVRIGIKRGIFVYSVLSALSWVATALALNAGVPARALYMYIPVMILSAVIVAALLRGKYKENKSLEVLCGLNIAVNIGTTGSFILAFI